MIELRHLRSLLAIAETGKLAAAAERVYLTQSALSHQVKLLEKHYAISLFERTSTGLRFTPGGTRLLRLAQEAGDFANQTLITYPVPEDRIDMIREVLKPAGVPFKRRTAELTIAILQLVASKRGLAALPNWGLKNYIEQDYVLAKRIGRSGLWSDLYATSAQALMKRPFAQDLMRIVREHCVANLDGIELL